MVGTKVGPKIESFQPSFGLQLFPSSHLRDMLAGHSCSYSYLRPGVKLAAVDSSYLQSEVESLNIPADGSVAAAHLKACAFSVDFERCLGPDHLPTVLPIGLPVMLCFAVVPPSLSATELAENSSL